MRAARKIALALAIVTLLAAPMLASAQLVDKKALTLEAAKRIAAAAEAEARKNSWTMVIAIVDEGGHLMYLERIDETQTGSIRIAVEKARSAVAFSARPRCGRMPWQEAGRRFWECTARCPSRAACP